MLATLDRRNTLCAATLSSSRFEPVLSFSQVAPWSVLFIARPFEPVMTTLPWVLIPGYLVPLLFMTHVLMLAQLGAHAPAVDLRAQRL